MILVVLNVFVIFNLIQSTLKWTESLLTMEYMPSTPPLTSPGRTGFFNEFIRGAEPRSDVGAVNVGHLYLEVPGVGWGAEVTRVVVDGDDAE